MSAPEPPRPNAFAEPATSAPVPPAPYPPPGVAPYPPKESDDDDEIDVDAYVALIARRNVIWMAISGVLLGYVSFFNARAEAPALEFLMPYLRLAFPLLVVGAFVLMIGRTWVIVFAMLVAFAGAVGWTLTGVYLISTGIDKGGGWGLMMLGIWWLYWAQLNGRVLRRLRDL